jgi:hypothetical protein
MSEPNKQPGKDDEWSVADDNFNKLADQESGKGEEGQATNEDRAAKHEQDQLDKLTPDSKDKSDDTGKGAHKKKRQVRITKKQAAGLGGAGLAIGGSMWIFTVVQGPLQLIHFSQLLQSFHFTGTQEFEGRRNFFFMYHLVRGEAHRSRLGLLGNRYADKIERRLNERSGLGSLYDSRTGRFDGYEILNEKKARQHLRDFGADGVPVRESIPDHYTSPGRRAQREIDRGAQMVDLSSYRGRNGQKVKRKSINTVLKARRILHIPGGLSSWSLVTRAGVDFHNLGVKRRAGEKLVDFWDRRKKQRSEYRKRGLEANQRRLEGQNNDGDGDGEADRDDTSASADAGNELTEEMSGADTPSKRSAIVRRLLSGGSILAAFATALCIVNDVSEDIDMYQYDNVILPLIRTGTEIISVGDQIRSSGLQGLLNSDVNMEELGAFASALNQTDPETGKETNWVCSASIQRELGKEPTCPDIDPEARPANVGEKNFLFQFTDRMGSILDTACGISDSVIGSIPIVRDVVNLASSVVEGAINAALSIFDTSIAELYDAVVSFFAGEAIDTFAEGPDLGNQGSYGAYLANKEYVGGLGGAPLNEEERHDIKRDVTQALEQERENKSFFARVFDVTDAHSMVATAMREVPQSPTQTLVAMFGSPFKFFGNFFTPAYARHVNLHDYGIEDSGFTIEEQNDPRVQDPFENAEIVEPQLDELNSEFGECFGTRVVLRGEDEYGLILSDFQDEDDREEAARRYREMPDKCRTDENNDHIEDNEDLLRYRFFIADTTQYFTIACNEGDEEACEMLVYGVDEEEGTLPAGPTDTHGCPTQPVPESETVEVSPGTRVHRCIEEPMRRLFADARAAGVNFGGGGWRDIARQRELRVINGCPDVETAPSSSCRVPTARPGSSQHERGLAIDFTLNGGTVRHGDAGWNWLVAHGAQYGLINLPSESWHWSTTGH